eukprot:m.188242 g.188242  ORF g.188242 m.188242 type:complete len:254 (+) comp18180_c2_seq3:481-1242(+)
MEYREELLEEQRLDNFLKQAPSRTDTERLLMMDKSSGVYIVRESSSVKNQYVLSMYSQTEKKIFHYLIMFDATRRVFKTPSNLEFDTFKDLIVYFKSPGQQGLPEPLSHGCRAYDALIPQPRPQTRASVHTTRPATRPPPRRPSVVEYEEIVNPPRVASRPPAAAPRAYEEIAEEMGTLRLAGASASQPTAQAYEQVVPTLKQMQDFQSLAGQGQDSSPSRPPPRGSQTRAASLSSVPMKRNDMYVPATPERR